ncbi:MAG: MFS transporter [Austwickia sp.]|nr:MFS transporter [Austwickia sp.]MBK9102210.1 MFS transporter [Austwickia sp.]
MTPTRPGESAGSARRPRRQLALAAAAVALAAADTYVVVLALPQMMAGVRLNIDDLQQATPIISGFLLGYVAVLPLIGALTDLLPRRTVLLGCLALFVAGSAVTALAVELPVLVAGRVVQGVGGGGLVPATLALVADLWSPERRGLPLGVVSAVQEVGSVLGPLLGAAVLAFADWRAIFWLNVLLALVLAGGLWMLARRDPPPEPHRRAVPGRSRGAPLLGVVGAGLLGVALWAPYRLVVHVTWGLPFVPFVAGSRVLTPIGLVSVAILIAAAAWQWLRWRQIRAGVDLWGASLMALALGALVLTFASADPERDVVGPLAGVLAPVGVLAIIGYVVRHRRATAPLIPRGILRRRVVPALLVSLAVGAALVAVVVNVPVLARLTVTDDHTQAAFILLRFLAAVPVGAVIGGWLLRWLPAGVVAVPALAVTSAALALMAGRGAQGVAGAGATAVLIAAGLGVGAAAAPVNAAALADSAHAHHGMISSLVVLARMVGMIVGLALLTAIGLRRFYAAAASLSPGDVAGLRLAGVVQVQTVFAGAAWVALAGAVGSGWLGWRSGSASGSDVTKT